MKIALGILSTPLILQGISIYITATNDLRLILSGVLLTGGFVALAGAAICDRLDSIKEQSAQLAGMNKDSRP